MTDDVKAAWERVRDRHWRFCHDEPCLECADYETVDLYIDGEQARQDASVAAAREECLGERPPSGLVRERALADRIAGLENYFTHARDLALEFDRRLLVEIGEHAETTAELLDTQTRAEKAEAERDALRVGESELVRAVEWQQQRAMKAESECDALRAQVEAAIKTAEAIRADEDTPSGWGREVAWRILRAMDGAKP